MARPKKQKTESNKYQSLGAQVKVTKKYFDMVLNKIIEPNDQLDVTQERAKQLVDAKVAVLVCLKN